MKVKKRTILKFAAVLSLLLFVNTADGQCVTQRAKEHFQTARTYDAMGDERAEAEYRQAIANANGRCPDAWEWLSHYLAKRLRFAESARAWRTYIKQRHWKAGSNDLLKLRLLDRAAELSLRSANMQPLSADDMVELVGLVDRFGTGSDAIPFAENAVKLHPESAKVLVTLANLIKSEQQDRALELLNRAATLANDALVFNSRGWFYLWSKGKAVEAESDFRRAIELSNGSSASSWQGLGEALSRQGRRKEAINAYRKYLEVRPPSASHHDEVIRQAIKNLEPE